MNDNTFIGHMLIARRPCGKVFAAAWCDEGCEAENEALVSEWKSRGGTVEKIARYAGDPQLEWICRPKCDLCFFRGAE